MTKKEKKKEDKDLICGTLIYNAPEALRGRQDAKSDAYSLGMTMYTLFNCFPPFLGIPEFQMKFREQGSLSAVLLRLMEEESFFPDIELCQIFLNLKEQGGKKVAKCLAKVFEGLTKINPEKRMSVHEARIAVQKIKPLVPRFGMGVKCPSIGEIVESQLIKYDGYPGDVVDPELLVPKKGWFTSIVTSISL
eukprot:gnl/Carplike_NY0171/8594_a11927_196.p1 GENE.gnl/Carplike_NY0171/8594_a11927_196~~gnl/Carplike_NY0171/8594_a11927_196.p1  ORF type:complete len:212 (-),score=36.50 gnl/Carplike_NY0171/8594_a11927_196:257-832(-)